MQEDITMPTESIPTKEPMPASKPSRLTRLSVIAGAGLLATLVAAGLGGVASAQTVIDDEPTARTTRVMQNQVAQADDGELDEFEFSAEDEAVWQRFEQCLTDAGLPAELDTDSGAADIEPDEATIDAAFEQCDPILDELSAGVFVDGEGGFGDLSDADEAIFDQYDECLDAGGIDALFGDDEAAVEVDEAAIDALFGQCDPILDGLSEEAQELFGDCPEDDDHTETEQADA